MTAFSMCPNRPYKRLSHDGVNDNSALPTCLDNEYQNHNSTLANQIDLPSTR